MDLTAPLVTRLVKMARNPLLRPLTSSTLALLREFRDDRESRF
ncbi:MAG: hypothetical protein AAFY88_22820 [Acidobacteriota bacterium]